MATQIHGAGPAGQRSPGLDLAIAGYLADNPPAGGGGTVFYGSDANTARPDSSHPVIWIGATGIVPVNAIEDFDIIVAFEPPPEPEPGPPANAPTLSVVAVSESRIDGTITPLIDATGYEWVIESGTQSGDPTTGTPVDIEAATTFQATGLTTETTHTFWARGYNEDGPGPWSAPQVETTTGPLLEFVEDFNITPATQRLANDPRWMTHIAPHVTVVNDDPTYGDYATTAQGGTLVVAARVDPVADPFPPDQWVEADVAYLYTATFARVIVFTRASGDADYYYGEIDNSGSWKLASVVAGVDTDLASGSMALPAYPYTLRLEAKGSQITLLINDTELATVANSDHATGQPGLGFNRAGNVCTEFRAGELP